MRALLPPSNRRLRRTGRGRAGLALVCAAGFALASAAFASPEASASSTPTGASPQPGPSVSSVALPGGDRVVYQGTVGVRTYSVVGPDGRSVPFFKFDSGNGNVYVIPDSALSDAGSLDIAQYDVPELSHSAAPASTPSVTPHYALQILQIDANDLTGAPAQNAVSILINVDSVQKFAAVIPDAAGVARVAVPVGNYALYTGFIDTDANGDTTGVHMVLKDDLVMPGAGGVVTATADERAAGAEVTAATPRPTVSQDVTLNLTRTDATGATVGLQAVAPGNVFVTPDAAPKVGTLGSQVIWDGVSPADTASPYRYDLAFAPVANVPANERFPVSAKQLATLHYGLDTDAANTARSGLYEIGAVNLAVGGVAEYYPVTVPEQLTDYVTAPLPTGFMWLQTYQPEVGKAPDNAFLYLQPGNAVAFTAGQQVWRTWGHGPLAPQVGQFTGPNSCYSCVSGTTMWIDFNGEATDSAPQTQGYFGAPYGQVIPVAENFAAYLNGKQVANEPGDQGAQLENIPQQTGTYRAVFDVDASGVSAISQSTKTVTDVTFVYNPAGDPDSTLPADDACYEAEGSSTPCQILPMLNLNYQLNTDATDTSHGVSILDLTVGHLSFDGQGSQAPAACAKVQVSFNGGKTWTTAATVPIARDKYLAAWPDTGAKGSRPWLRITATDTIGGSITQTIANAYTIG